jgi:hypothetical protein
MEWQKSLGGSDWDFATSIQQTTDGGFVVAGESFSIDGDVSGNHGFSDYWIVKLDSTGTIEWQKSLGGTDDDVANSIQQTTDGGFLVGGRSYSNDGDVSGNHGYYDYWIVKLDLTGTLEWQKSLGGADLDIATSIQQTTDGGFVVAGYSESNDGDVSGHHGSSSDADYWIVKLDAAGTIEWQKSLGGTYEDVANSIQQTTDGGYVVAGSSESNDGDVSGHHGSTSYPDYWIVKLDYSPAGIEICNNLDDDCDGSTDDGLGAIFYYADVDGDNYGDVNSSVSSCAPVSGYVTDSTDCNDNNAAINPAATEICNYIDDNCNGSIDDGLNFTTYYSDGDGDTYGDALDAGTALCSNPGTGYTTNNSDCDDNNASVNPSAIEICNNLDDNCNGSIDDGVVFTTYYLDADGDSYGDAGNSLSSCTPVSGYVTNSTDCDDGNAAINPSAAEICNYVDDNCNGTIDDGLQTVYYADADGDNYGDAGNSVSSCTPVSGYVTNSADCDDSNPDVNPAATEICNGLDDNCINGIDDGLVFTTYYADADGDNYGDANNSISNCETVNGYILDNTDCDDTNADVNPGAVEISNNGIDDDCDGDVDEFGVGVSAISTGPSSLTVFPNPTNGAFVIELKLSDEESSEAKIEVLNLLGQVIISEKATLNRGELQREIQLSDAVAQGMYLVKVTINDKVFTAQMDLQK